MTSPRVAIVTGAARGIGEAIAQRLGATATHLIVADVDSQNAERVASTLPSGEPAEIDVRSTAALTELIATVHRTHGALDILVNNAAITKNTPLAEIDVNEWDSVLEVNLRSTFFACQAAAPLMARNGWGRIVNLTSLAGQQGGVVAGAHYAASKAGIVVLTKIFAGQFAADGVTVNAVAPAAIDGPVMRQLPQTRIDKVATMIPVHRIGTPAEVAAAVAFLCSDEAGYITGATLDINGGLSMR